MINRGFDQPQYIGYQHHILDRIIKHVSDYLNLVFSTKPILYEFLEDVVKFYENLKQNFIIISQKLKQKLLKIQVGRDDFKFLFELHKHTRY